MQGYIWKCDMFLQHNVSQYFKEQTSNQCMTGQPCLIYPTVLTSVCNHEGGTQDTGSPVMRWCGRGNFVQSYKSSFYKAGISALTQKCNVMIEKGGRG